MAIKYYIHYDATTGDIIERRPQNIAYPAPIAEPVIEATEEQFQSTLSGNKRINPSDKTIEDAPPAVMDLVEAKAAKKQEIANARYQTEIAGITVSGILVATDDRSKAFIWAAAAKAREDPSCIIGWKAADGGWVDIGSNAIIAVADAVTEWVEKLFARERYYCELIDGRETVEQVQTLKWSLE